MSAPESLLGRSRETEIRRDAQGRWWNGRDPITHPAVTRSFDGWIERAEDGRYRLANAVNWAYVTIEGPPFFVRGITLERPSIDAMVLHLSGGLRERLDADSLAEAEDGSLWCAVRGGLEARFDSHAAMQLEPLLGSGPLGTWLEGDGRRVVPRRR